MLPEVFFIQFQFNDSNFIQEAYQFISKCDSKYTTQKLNESQRSTRFQSKKSEYNEKNLEEYINFFEPVENIVNDQIENCLKDFDSLKQHKIIMLSEKGLGQKLISLTKPFIMILDNQLNGSIIKYEIIIGKFKLKINLLNLKQQAPSNLQNIGSGAFGQIYKIHFNAQKVISKRIHFKGQTQIFSQQNQNFQITPNKTQIQDSLCEYSLYKICSFFKIGPKIVSIFGFQIICYQNCIQFFMEECIPLQKLKNYRGTSHQFKTRLKICIRILHKFKIIHKDIKPSNILYSQSLKQFVVTDFGISHSVQEEVGVSTYTYKDGTESYMSPQMLASSSFKKNYVDLYYNDLWALKLTIQNVVRSKLKILKNFKDSSIDDPFYESIKIYCIVTGNKEQDVISELSKMMDKINENLMIQRITDISPEKSENLILRLQEMLLNESEYSKNEINKFQRLKKILQNGQILSNFHIKIKYLLRIYGLHQIVIDYILANKKQIKVQSIYQKLIQTIQKHNQSHHTYQDIEKLEKLGQSKKIIQVIQKQLNVLQQKLKLCNSNRDLITMKQMIQKLIIQKIKRKDRNYISYCRKILDKLCRYDIKQIYQTQIIVYKKLINYIQSAQSGFDISGQLREISNYDPKEQFRIIQNIFQIFYQNNDVNKVIQFFQLLNQIKLHDVQNISQRFGNILITLGNIYYKICQYNKALQMYKSALKSIKQQSRDWINNSTAIFNNIGICYQRLMCYSQARAYYQKDLKIEIRQIGESHPQIAVSYNNIANCYLFEENYTKALQFYQKSKKIYQITVGEKHPYTSICSMNMGLCLLLLKQFQKAQSHLYKVLSIQIQIFGQNNENTLRTISNLGLLFYQKQQYYKSKKYFQIAIRNGKNYIPKNYHALADCHKQLGSYNHAIQFYLKPYNSIYNEIAKDNNIKSIQIQFYQIFYSLLYCCNSSKKYEYMIYLIRKTSKLFNSVLIDEISNLHMSYMKLKQISHKKLPNKKLGRFLKFENNGLDKLQFNKFRKFIELAKFYFSIKKQVEFLLCKKYIQTQFDHKNTEIKKQYSKLVTKQKKINKQILQIFNNAFQTKKYTQKSNQNTCHSLKNIHLKKRIIFLSKNFKIFPYLSNKLRQQNKCQQCALKK